MDMDMSSAYSHHWLSFSLSNNYHHGLLEALSTTSAPPLGEEGATEDAPKMEDFLGGVGGGGGGAAPVAAPEDQVGCGELGSIAAGFLRRYPTTENAGGVTIAMATDAVEADPARRPAETFGQRTSIYRGVTRHRWTGRYEAHLWDNSCRREGQSRKGRQVYLGGYDKEEKAARAYDLAALKYWGPTTTTNFPVANYEKELEEMKSMTRQEFIASLRRKSSGFSRGASIYRGVTRHHQHGRWQARIGRVAGNKDLYLGTFSTQEEAAEAYDIAAIKFRGLNAVTNFDMSRYDVDSILNSDLPVGGGGAATRASRFPSDPSLPPPHGAGASAAMPPSEKDYWSLLALHYQQQQQQFPGSAFDTYGSSGVNVDFTMGTSSHSGSGSSSSAMWGTAAGAMGQQDGSSSNRQSSSYPSNIPYAAAAAAAAMASGSAGYEGSTGNNGTWVASNTSTAPHFYNYLFGME
ncbi:AP2-like ethylene-responsive transcription factor AIL5 [Oryza brachyantha]|uniref:AP2-like ethylene-responsive transcription factor AIL5 n=1 Tax=Oryza brachyantha TaxID=4533 RepID=UPI001ADC2FA2|nr:AP2-like ethylene-responsive transcription factor AIL5 [Oryza brachyantha]